MSTSGDSLEVRQALRRMRRLALAFHGSELRLLNRSERKAKVVQHTAPPRPVRETQRVGA